MTTVIWHKLTALCTRIFMPVLKRSLLTASVFFFMHEYTSAQDVSYVSLFLLPIDTLTMESDTVIDPLSQLIDAEFLVQGFVHLESAVGVSSIECILKEGESVVTSHVFEIGGSNSGPYTLSQLNNDFTLGMSIHENADSFSCTIKLRNSSEEVIQTLTYQP